MSSDSFYICAPTTDDLMRYGYQLLFKNGIKINPSKGPAIEVIGVTLELTNPRARLSQTSTRGKIFSALGELCWYLTGSNSSLFMDYYIKNYTKENADDPDSDHPFVNGAYGPRIFSKIEPSQFAVVRDILNRKSDSRQAVIQIFKATDIRDSHIDVPCTCLMQFFLREEKLNLIVYMRSNDIFLGLPNDIFAFTMIQEIMARSIGKEMGYYKHIAGSFHMYETDRARAVEFISEGWTSTTNFMPHMPEDDPWAGIEKLLTAERELREYGTLSINPDEVHAYWADLINILRVYAVSQKRLPDSKQEIARIMSEISNNFYTPYILPKT